MKKVEKAAKNRSFLVQLRQNIIKFTKSDTFKYFLAYFALAFVAFCGFLNQTQISDNVQRMDIYNQMSLGEFMNEGTTSINGRWGNITFYLIHKPLSALGFTYNHNQWLFFLLDMIVIAIALTILFSIFKKLINPNKKSALILFLSIGLIAINPFMVEALAFMIPNHPQALLCVALAIYFQTSAKKGRYLWATLFAIAAICTYQSYYAHLFILGLIALYLQNKGKFDKKLAVNAIKHIGTIIAGMATYFISVFAYCKIMNVEQAQSTTSNLSPLHLLRELLHVLRMAAENLWKGCGIYHLRGILILILAAAAIYLLIKLIQSHKKQNIIYGILFIGVALVVPVAYGAVSTEFYLAPRILISYFTVLAGFLILTLYYKPSTKTTIAITILLALFSAINIFQASSLITDIQISNAVELSELELIHKQIDIYEAESGQTIDTVVVYNTGRVGEMTFDQTHTNHPEGYNTSHLITSTEWSNVAWLQKVTGKPYRHIEKSANDADFREVFPEYQPEQLTRFVPSERLKFDQNTLYWITY